MTITRVSMLLGAALVMGSAAGAQAADLYGAQGGSIKDGYVAPVVCCKPAWYFRIDGGYSYHNTPKANAEGAELSNVSWDNTGFIGGGVGMYIGSRLRADFTYDHGFATDVRATAGTNIVGNNPVINAKLPMSRDLFLFNVYYDIDTGSRFTPYVGGGVGIVRHTLGTGILTQVLNDGTHTGTIENSDSTNFAAAAMVGGSFALSGGAGGCGGGGGGFAGSSACGAGVLLDVGYRFVYEGKAHTGDTHYANISGDPDITDLLTHEIRAGIRYNFN